MWKYKPKYRTTILHLDLEKKSVSITQVYENLGDDKGNKKNQDLKRESTTILCKSMKIFYLENLILYQFY